MYPFQRKKKIPLSGNTDLFWKINFEIFCGRDHMRANTLCLRLLLSLHCFVSHVCNG